MRPEEILLIERCQKGDVASLDALFQAYEDKAFGYALKLTQHSEEAADIVSDAFIRAIKGIGHFKLDSHFATWLYRIIRNCFFDRMKKRRVEIVDTVQIADGPEGDSMWLQVPDPGKSPFDLVEEDDTSRWIQARLATLPESHRRVLTMYYWDDLSYNEISDSVAIPAGTVKSRLSRTRECLRAVLSVDSTFAEHS